MLSTITAGLTDQEFTEGDQNEDTEYAERHPLVRAHVPSVELVTGRFPYRPACSCGFEFPWGYVAEHAARDIAQAHVDAEATR